MPKGWIFNVQRFSVHDGPGIRTTVFLKGCNLRCWWCHNPESWRMGTDMEVHPDRCIGCLACVEVCQHRARSAQDGALVFDRELCHRCGACAEACFAGAIEAIGREVDPSEVLDLVSKDAPFYQQSEGGVTLSGGEPLLQPAFCAEVLDLCQRAGLHTAVDTAACVEWAALEAVIPVTDLFLLDIKAMDSVLHKTGTGKENKLVLANAQKLAQTNKPIWVRMPIIPDFNNNVAEVAAVARFCGEMPGLERLELLTYHRLGVSKRNGLGMDDHNQPTDLPDPKTMESLADVARGFGVEVIVR